MLGGHRGRAKCTTFDQIIDADGAASPAGDPGAREVRDEEGVVIGTTFTVDMNRLFERFIEVVVKDRLRDSPYVLETQARRRLTAPGASAPNLHVPAINMRPDLLLIRDGKVAAVGDAKDKELLRIGDWEHPDIYQLLAYCVRLGLDSGLLIYAGQRPLTQSAVVGSAIKLSTIGVDLSGSPDAIIAQARQTADALIGTASPVMTTAAA